MDMDIDSSSEENVDRNSPDSSQSYDKRAEAESNDDNDTYENKHGKEEGEIDSDVSSSAEISPERKVQIASEGMFSEKTLGKYSENSDDEMRGKRDSPADSQRTRGVVKEGDHSSDDSYSDYDDDNDADVSRDAPDDSLLETKESYREGKVMSSSDEDMSSDEEEKPSVEERRDTDELSVELSASDSETSSDEDDREDQKGTKRRDGAKGTEIIDISADESGADVISIGIKSDKDSDQGSLREKNVAEDKPTVKSSPESDSESDNEGDAKYSKPKSLVFKKKGTSDSKKDNASSGKRKDRDDESEEAVVDHLDIAAPQQALLRESKKKSSKVKLKKHSKSEKSSSTGEKSKHKDEKRKHKEDKVRSDSREREKERRDKREDSYEKKHRKHGDSKHSKYDSKSEQGVQKPRSIIEKKRVEEDLRRTLLQKRSTREEIAVKQPKLERSDRETSKKEEKHRKDKEKSDKSKAEHSARYKKEGREKVREKGEAAVRKSKAGKEIKESKKEKEPKKDREKEKSSKTVDTEKGKKRPREKTKSKSARDKYRSESESSEEEDAKKEPSKHASKRPRSADENKVKETKVDKSPEEKKESSKTTGINYDDISPVSSEIELTPPPSPVELKKPTYYPAIMGCRDVKEFQWLNKIEEGTYGVVYRARDIRTSEIVALKRLKMEKEKEGFPITSLREINTLLKAQHPNIVTVREIVVGSNMDKIYIVMDYVEHDLKALMETMTQPFLVGEVKTLMIQLLRGVNHMHDNWILHRDIKASNLLLSHKGILKVGDFGLAREYGSPLKNYTPIVVTLWYRAPELLLGGKEYKTAIDLWSVGCVFAELLLMKPLFPGKSEIDQINRIFKELGTPNDNIWPGPPAYSEYSLVKKDTRYINHIPWMLAHFFCVRLSLKEKITNFANHPYNVLRNRFGATFTDKGFNLLNRFLTYDPKKRITAEEALRHEYFEESPLPVDPSMFPTWPAKSELGYRAARKHNASPKPPEGGGAASKLANQDANLGFHMPATTKGISAKGAGFNLKF